MVCEWVVGFNTVSVWAGLWVDRCVCGGGSSEFHGGGCGCCLVGLVGVGLVDFFFFVVGYDGGGGCVCGCDGCV